MELGQPRIKIVPDIENFQNSIAALALANSFLYHIYHMHEYTCNFLHFVNSCIDHIDCYFIFDLRVNLDSLFWFVSFFNRVQRRTG